uniref:SMB domain-containing protein n=1 Tax=Entomoneis paludosa TaxID=265537 RepID=A0A7S2YH08_9STRA|mmetsp:Transcript_32714/g.68215  ORF Transcript_32714/g.68215 Transcript_32714/m.68215 type:complete len:361 (+) Transcript_32714:156-1238(+)
MRIATLLFSLLYLTTVWGRKQLSRQERDALVVNQLKTNKLDFLAGRDLYETETCGVHVDCGWCSSHEDGCCCDADCGDYNDCCLSYHDMCMGTPPVAAPTGGKKTGGYYYYGKKTEGYYHGYYYGKKTEGYYYEGKKSPSPSTGKKTEGYYYYGKKSPSPGGYYYGKKCPGTKTPKSKSPGPGSKTPKTSKQPESKTPKSKQPKTEYPTSASPTLHPTPSKGMSKGKKGKGTKGKVMMAKKAKGKGGKKGYAMMMTTMMMMGKKTPDGSYYEGKGYNMMMMMTPSKGHSGGYDYGGYDYSGGYAYKEEPYKPYEVPYEKEISYEDASGGKKGYRRDLSGGYYCIDDDHEYPEDYVEDRRN